MSTYSRTDFPFNGTNGGNVVNIGGNTYVLTNVIWNGTTFVLINPALPGSAIATDAVYINGRTYFLNNCNYDAYNNVFNQIDLTHTSSALLVSGVMFAFLTVNPQIPQWPNNIYDTGWYFSLQQSILPSNQELAVTGDFLASSEPSGEYVLIQTSFAGGPSITMGKNNANPSQGMAALTFGTGAPVGPFPPAGGVGIYLRTDGTVGNRVYIITNSGALPIAGV